MPVPLLALAAAAFGVGTSEFVIMGLLPEIARDLGVSIPAVGLLVTGYAIGVVIGAPLMAIVTNGLPRKATLVGLMVIFVVGNLFCAVAPNYELLMGARVFTALAHAAFFGIAAIVAADLVAQNRRATAIALVFAGLTVANIMGVPAGTVLGQAFGWRSTFWVVSALGIGATVAIALLLPTNLAVRRANLSAEFRVLMRPQILIALSITVLSSSALFAVFTFIAPILTEVTGLAESSVSWVLLLFGVGMTAGSVLGGRLADWKVMPAIITILVAIATVFLAMLFTMPSPVLMVVTIFVWGLFAFSIAPSLQIRVVNVAAEAPNVASTINQGAFNLGNAIGAWAGASLLTSGAAYIDLPWLGFGLAAAALLAALVSFHIDRRRAAEEACDATV